MRGSRHPGRRRGGGRSFTATDCARRAAPRYRGGVQGSGARGSSAVTTSTPTGALAPIACWRAAAIAPGCSTRMPRTPKLRATTLKSVGPKRIRASPRSARSPAIRCTPVKFWPKPELLLTRITTGMWQRRADSVVYLQPASNSDRPPIRYNAPFTTCVRGLGHGIQPRFLPACADCPGVVVSDALLVVAIGARSRSTDTTHASDATTQTLHSTQTLYGSRSQAPLRRLCASDRRPQASAAFRSTPEACLNPWTSAPRRHLTPLLSRCGRSLWRLARAGQYQRQRSSPWWPLATAVLQQLSG